MVCGVMDVEVPKTNWEKLFDPQPEKVRRFVVEADFMFGHNLLFRAHDCLQPKYMQKFKTQSMMNIIFLCCCSNLTRHNGLSLLIEG